MHQHRGVGTGPARSLLLFQRINERRYLFQTLDKGPWRGATDEIRIHDKDLFIVHRRDGRKTQPFVLLPGTYPPFAAHDRNDNHIRILGRHLFPVIAAIPLTSCNIDPAGQDNKIIGKGTCNRSKQGMSAHLHEHLLRRQAPDPLLDTLDILLRLGNDLLGPDLKAQKPTQLQKLVADCGKVCRLPEMHHPHPGGGQLGHLLRGRQTGRQDQIGMQAQNLFNIELHHRADLHLVTGCGRMHTVAGIGHQPITRPQQKDVFGIDRPERHNPLGIVFILTQRICR